MQNCMWTKACWEIPILSPKIVSMVFKTIEPTTCSSFQNEAVNLISVSLDTERRQGRRTGLNIKASSKGTTEEKKADKKIF